MNSSSTHSHQNITRRTIDGRFGRWRRAIALAGLTVTAGLNAKVAPLAQDYTLVYRNPDSEYYIAGIGLERLGESSYLAALPVVPRSSEDKTRRATHSKVLLVRSADEGKTWKEVSRLPYYSAVPWMHRGKLFLFANRGGVDFRGEDLLLLSSDDQGKTWSQPTRLLKGHFWNCHTNMVVQDNRLYWAVDDFFPGPASGIRLIVADLSRDLMKLAAWRFSETLPFPGLPESMGNRAFPADKSNMTEANVVSLNGKIRVLASVQARNLTTSGLTAVLDVTDTGQKVGLAFSQFYPSAGGQHKRGMLWDEKSRLFWATGNQTVDSQEAYPWWEDARQKGKFAGSGGNDRRFLMLFYSADALNWFQAGCVAQGSKVSQSFMYTRPMVVGNDLVILSRSSVDAPNQHDADCATFHRVTDFRNFALNLVPAPEK